MDQISSGYFSPDNPHMFGELVDHLLNHDRFKLLADFEAYVKCQDHVSEVFKVLNFSRI